MGRLTATEPDSELLRRVAAGDTEAFSAFYDRHEALLVAFLVRRTRNAEQAADLALDTFAIALATPEGFEERGHGALGWLFGIAANLAAQAARRGAIDLRARLKLGLSPIEFSDETLERVESLIDAEDSSSPLSLALAALPDGERAAVLARIVDEKSYEEAARELGTTEGAVRQRVSRGLTRLRTNLQKGDHV